MQKNALHYYMSSTEKQPFQYTNEAAFSPYQNIKPPTKEAFSYYYSYSYHYKWLNTPQNVLGHYQINRNTHLTLTSEELFIRQNQQEKKLYLSDIQQVRFNFKRLLLPILVGGVISPLMFFKIFETGLNSWWAIFLAFGSLLLFYYGWQGSYQLQIQAKHNTHAFFIQKNTTSIQNFIRLFRQKINQRLHH